MNRLVFVCAAGLVCFGCGSNKAPESEPVASNLPQKSVDEANGATITGKVVFSGTAPKPQPISMDATPKCAQQHPQPVLSEEVIVNGNGTLRNAFVWVKSGLPEARWTPEPQGGVTIDQVGCVYKPHVVGIRTGQPVEFTNSDPTNHNIHPMPRENAEFNMSQPPQSEKISRKFSKPEVMIPVKCNVHPWMRVWVGVVDHPFFAVTGDDGIFTLKGLPPGDYTLEVWHERYGKQEAKVTVGAKDSKTVDFTYKG
jgi:plastocyanin